MRYTKEQVSSASSLMDRYRDVGETAEIGAALAVVGLSATRAEKEMLIRDNMIRVAHATGASVRQIAKVSGLDRKTVTTVVSN